MVEAVEGFTLIEKSNELLKGWVSSEEALQEVLEAHAIQTGSNFVSW
jgi:hypothetical protein